MEPQVRFVTVPATVPRIRAVAYCVLTKRRTVIFLHGEVISCAIRNNARPLLNLYIEAVPAADATRRIAVSSIPISTKYV